MYFPCQLCLSWYFTPVEKKTLKYFQVCSHICKKVVQRIKMGSCIKEFSLEVNSYYIHVVYILLLPKSCTQSCKQGELSSVRWLSPIGTSSFWCAIFLWLNRMRLLSIALQVVSHCSFILKVRKSNFENMRPHYKPYWNSCLVLIVLWTFRPNFLWYNVRQISPCLEWSFLKSR